MYIIETNLEFSKRGCVFIRLNHFDVFWLDKILTLQKLQITFIYLSDDQALENDVAP